MSAPRQRPHAPRARRLWLLGLTLMACGGSSIRADSAGDVDLDALTQRAGQLIVDAVAAPETEHAALTELQMAGAAGVPWTRLALRGATAVRRETRLALWLALARRGDETAISALRQTTDNDGATVAARLSVIDEAAFRRALAEALRHSSAPARHAALTRLRTSPVDSALRLELEALARHDPEAEVRATAIDVLTQPPPVSIAFVEAMLTDRDALVRSVAMRALARLDCTRAYALLAERLSAPPTRDGLAAIRALVPCGAPVLAASLDALRRSLLVSDNALRAEAAMTANAFRWLRVPDWLAHVMAHDPAPAVVLGLSLALQATQPEIARATFHKLATAQHPVVSVQAAASLADMDDAAGLALLRTARAHADPVTRRAAYRALGRHGDLRERAPGLDDRDATVRLAAAGSILRAAL